MEHSIACQSYAKLNLYLDVLGKRRDGYHNIETLFQTVSLSDRLRFVEQDRQISLACTAPGVPCDESNLAWRAACLLRKHTGSTRGTHIEIEKRIPAAAGLAGGSGNAAATLVALNRLWGLHLSSGRLRALARRLGADVAYCTVGGPVAAWLRGEALAPLPALPPTWFVLVHPPAQVSTADVYHSPHLPKNTSPTFAGRTTGFRRAIHALRDGALSETLYNAMERVVFELHPKLADVKKELVSAGCAAAGMSGSGPTMFGLCRSEADAQDVAGRLGDHATSVVRAVPYGVAIEA